ncbi:hypothetical protein [Kitasatospora sp. NPDC056531]
MRGDGGPSRAAPCTAFGGSGVLAAGLVCALAVAVGVLIHSRESRASTGL